MIAQDPLPFQDTVGFLITERCNLQCKHCVVAAGRGGADMARADLHRWLQEVRRVEAVRTVCLTGGEPFVVYDLLQEAVAQATALKLRATVVSNGYWAKRKERGLRLLQGLPGLARLALSVDRFHLEFIPLETIRNAILAARELGIKAVVRVAYLAAEEVSEVKQLLKEVLDPEDVSGQPVIRAGRAARALAGESFPHLACDALCMSASRPAVALDGTVYACCLPPTHLNHPNPLWLGNAREQSLAAVLEAAQFNIPLQILRTRGPYQLWRLVRGHSDPLQHYDTTSLCGLCLSLMSDQAFLADLERVAHDAAILKRVAVERLFLFDEAEMLAGLPVKTEG